MGIGPLARFEPPERCRRPLPITYSRRCLAATASPHGSEGVSDRSPQAGPPSFPAVARVACKRALLSTPRTHSLLILGMVASEVTPRFGYLPNSALAASVSPYRGCTARSRGRPPKNDVKVRLAIGTDRSRVPCKKIDQGRLGQCYPTDTIMARQTRPQLSSSRTGPFVCISGQGEAGTLRCNAPPSRPPLQ